MTLFVREYSWMWNDLRLSLAECRVYAYIYGLSHGGKGGYNGSKRGLAKALGLSEACVRDTLGTLTEKSLISYTNGLWQSESRTDVDNAHSVRTDDAQSVRESANSVRESAQPVRSPRTPLYINNKNKKNSVTRKSANNTQNLILTKKYFEIDMETITDALSRKDSMYVIWSLLNPAPEFRELYNDFMRYWNRIERDRQLQIWYFLKRKIDNKQPLDPNPLEVLKNCHPYPINYNGTPGVNTMIKSEHKMVKAYHNGAYGIYEEMDARLWHMTRIEPLNFRASTCGAGLINK